MNDQTAVAGHTTLATAGMTMKSTFQASHMVAGPVRINLSDGSIERLAGFTTNDAAADEFWSAVERSMISRIGTPPTNSMVEKVARAIEGEMFGSGTWAKARAAIAAMREPTDAIRETMNEAACNGYVNWDDYLEAFIDAALKEHP